MRFLAGLAMLTALPVVVLAQVVRPPYQRLETDTELPDPKGLVVGVSGALVLVGEEAFEALAPGPGVQLFVGSEFGSVTELRAGISFSSHAEDVSDESARNLSVHLESYFPVEVLGLSAGVGPRLAWMQESRAAFVTDRVSGFGVGGGIFVSVQIASHVALETGVAATYFVFGAAELEGAPPDPDGQSYGFVSELRFGAQYRLE